jgi:chromosome partitioning protein
MAQEVPIAVKTEQTTARRPDKKKTTTTRKLQVLNRKGGAGKTTTVSNLAEVWGQKGYRVLAVDMDANGSLTKRMGIRPAELPVSIYELFMSPESLIKTRDVILQPEHLSFDLLPGSENLSYAEPSLLMASKQRALADRLAEVEDDYDIVIIDTAGHQSFLTSLVHVYADEVVIPMEVDKDHWDQLVTTLASVDKVRADGLNPNIRPRAIFINRYREGTTFGNSLLKKLKEDYPDLLFSTVTRENIRAKEAAAYGQPIVNYDPTGQPAHAYIKLAEFLE